MSEGPNMAMVMLLDQQSFLGESENIENEIMPIDSQLNFSVGDVAMVAATNTPVEKDFAVVRGVDPRKHADKFPDWEERMLNSYVLCEHFSRNDPEITLGWFSRLKLLPISQYRYRECRRWLKNGFPEQIPEWAQEYYQKYTDALSHNAPNMIPRKVTCPNCGERKVELRAVGRTEFWAKVGQLTVDGKERFVPINDVQTEQQITARLHCPNCHSSATLEDEEWTLPGITT